MKDFFTVDGNSHLDVVLTGPVKKNVLKPDDISQLANKNLDNNDVSAEAMNWGVAIRFVNESTIWSS